jgi:S-adenosylmethionine/arginine decarboxylase-like enzyme
MQYNTGPEKLIAKMKNLNGCTDGFQIVSTVKSNRKLLLFDFRNFKHFINDISASLGLKRSGEFYFNFADSGFTGIVCFNGSHFSLHTLPGTNQVSFDIFLSDRLLNNINVCEELYRQAVQFFDSEVVKESYAAL